MIDSITQEELAEAFIRLGYTSRHHAPNIFADIEAHREYFEVGEIYEDNKGRRLLRRENDLWPWQVITYVKGDPMTQHDGSHYGTLQLETFPERPLRKLVPEG